MILLELYFQELNREYDVQLDESLPVGGLIDDLVELIAQKEHLTLDKNPGLFLMYDKANRRILHPHTTLSENGIQSGQQLVLL